MKALIRDYLASLKEREELDAILPDLLSELDFTIFSRPQRGTTQYGVDVGAVGRDDDGERKVFLFSLKQGDLTRQDWDGTAQGLRSSLNEICDVYIPTRLPKRYQTLKIVICLCFGGDIQEQVRSQVKGFIDRNTTDRVSFDEWNGDKLAGLIIQGILREKVLPKALRSQFQKAVAMVDEPDIAYEHFATLINLLTKGPLNSRSKLRAARQIYICLWILFVWARDVDNVEAAWRASELALLRIWDLVRPHLGTKGSIVKALSEVLVETVQLHLLIAQFVLDHKIIPHVEILGAISAAVPTSSSVDVNLRLFDILGRLGLTGLWLHWLIDKDPDAARQEAMREAVGRYAQAGFAMISNNRSLFLPVMDQHAIDICLFLLLAVRSPKTFGDIRRWLHEMVSRLWFTLETHGRYPCIYTDYRDLADHPRQRDDEYRREATLGSILVPLIAAWLAGFEDTDALKLLTQLKKQTLADCTLQLWMPDEKSEDLIYIGDTRHGVGLTDLPLSDSGEELLNVIRDACDGDEWFSKLSSLQYGYWPLVLAACRHYRLPVPPQFWIKPLLPVENASAET